MGCRRDKDVLGNRQGLMLKDPGAHGETIHDLESKDPQTDLKPQKYHNHICVLGGQREKGAAALFPSVTQDIMDLKQKPQQVMRTSRMDLGLLA